MDIICLDDIFDAHVSSSSSSDELSDDEVTSTWLREQGQESIDAMNEGLIHSVECPDPEGCDIFCENVKNVINHCVNCMKRRFGECDVCSCVVAVTVFHSRVCNVTQCRIPFCEVIKGAIETYPIGSYHLVDLDHLVHRVIRRLQDLNPEKQSDEEEDGEAEMAVEEEYIWRPQFMEQENEISSTTID